MSIERIRTTVGHIVLMLGVVVSLFPFYWMLVMASNTTPDIFAYPPKLLIGSHLFENMGTVLDNVDFFGSMLLTLIASLGVTILVLFFDSLAAFAFAKYEFPGRNFLFGLLLATFMIPTQLSLVPQFVTLAEFGWIGSLKALIIPGAANSTPAARSPTNSSRPPRSTAPASSASTSPSDCRCCAPVWRSWVSSLSSTSGTTTSGRSS